MMLMQLAQSSSDNVHKDDTHQRRIVIELCLVSQGKITIFYTKQIYVAFVFFLSTEDSFLTASVDYI